MKREESRFASLDAMKENKGFEPQSAEDDSPKEGTNGYLAKAMCSLTKKERRAVRPFFTTDSAWRSSPGARGSPANQPPKGFPKNLPS